MTTATLDRTTNFQTVMVPCHPGGTVVCMASGPSLTKEDCDYVIGKATVVTVNDAWRLAPWADVLYSGDRYWWQHHKGVPGFPGLKVTIEFAPGKKPREVAARYPEIIILRNTGHSGVEVDRTGLRTGSNSGAQALNLAVHLGARRIVLLGYDMGVTGPKTHFFGDHPSPLNTQSSYPTFRQKFDLMAGPLAALGIEVVNCSRTTSLSSFPLMPLEEALP